MIRKALVLAVVAVACGSGNPEPLGVVPERSIADSQMRYSLVETGVQECMEEAGFEYIVHIPEQSFFEAGHHLKGPHNFVGDDPAYVSQYGYGLTRWVRAILSSGNSRVDKERSIRLDRELSYARGNQRELCFQEVNQEVNADRSRQVIDQIEGDWGSMLYDNLFYHQSVASAIPSWVDCMNNLGHNYISLEEPFDYVVQEATSVSEDVEDDIPEGNTDPRYALEVERRLLDVQQREVALATDDVQCRWDSGLMDAILEVREELQSQFIQDNTALLNEWAQYDNS